MLLHASCGNTLLCSPAIVKGSVSQPAYLEAAISQAPPVVTYLDAAIPQPPAAVLTFHLVKPAWQLRNALSSAACCEGALSLEPQMM